MWTSGALVNSADPNQKAASDQGLHCLLKLQEVTCILGACAKYMRFLITNVLLISKEKKNILNNFISF